MCGRYVSPETAAIERQWHIGRGNNNPFRRRFNVLPTTNIPILRHAPDADELELTGARWGFIPFWWSQTKPPEHGINARSEDAAKRPMWRDAYRKSRCLIPAEGWYEWAASERIDPKTGEIKAYKQPHFIYRADRKLICFAGFLSSWASEGEAPKLTCAIATRAAAPCVADVHDRMPVVLPESAFAAWLDPAPQSPEAVAGLIASAQTDFEHHPVSTRLNSAKNDDEGLLSPV